MSRSPLPTRAGETPTKVVFQGVEPGSAAARLLLIQHEGMLRQFQSKARQQRVLSDQGQYATHRQLPDGGSIRYIYNNGQETLLVQLNPGVLRELPEPPDYRLLPCNIVLAVDVLFDPEKFTAGDVYKKIPYLIHHTGGQPMYPNDPQYYTFDQEQLSYPGQPPDPNGNNYEAYIRANYSNVTIARGVVDVGKKLPTLGDSISAFQSDGYDSSWATIARAQALLASHIASATANLYNARRYYVVYFTGTNGGFFGETYSVGYNTWQIAEIYGRYTGPLTPDYDETAYHVVREKRTYLSVLPVVGLRVVPKDPKDPPYAAFSTGRYEDDRLIPLVKDEKVTIQRSIAFGDPTGGNEFVGAGFVAQLLSPFNPQVPPEEVEIEVYLASTNVQQTNQSPGREGSKFGTDDQSMNYSAFANVSYVLRVRELLDATGAPFIIKVSVDAEGKIEVFKQDQPNTVETTTMKADARHVDWWFTAATNQWGDGGRDPADPEAKSHDDKPTMGKLLAEKEGTAAVAQTDVISERRVPTKPEWKGSVPNMTRIATIKWKPPSACHVNGTADIDGGSAPPTPTPSGPGLPDLPPLG